MLKLWRDSLEFGGVRNIGRLDPRLEMFWRVGFWTVFNEWLRGTSNFFEWFTAGKVILSSRLLSGTFVHR